MSFADDVSVLRRGNMVYSGSLGAKTPAMLAELMMGNEEIAPASLREVIAKGDIRLKIDQLVVNNDQSSIAVDTLSLKVHAGEIVGIAGVSGNGQRELVEALSGQRQPVTGSIWVSGQPYLATREQMVRHKVFCLPEEPLRNACVPRMTLIENLALRIFDQPAFTRWRWFINHAKLKNYALGLIERYQIKPPLPKRHLETLSGGNIQRLVLAREISGAVALLIVANPCFGLDFAATAEIRKQLLAARNLGVAVLLISEDLDELLELSDRITVMFEGQLRYEASITDVNLDEIGLKMAGH
ncbi:ATP-binding cassette domain-containing protein [Methylocucumis oryzae]|uniref:ATP-binding cassette domain-containing protein n=1 Tax=Methylocucumis oryzae TaxID=1632867 RepID=UPI000697AF36|nr:ATP-binding cassette domain-containing protein [Methylocucumis oryzae]